MLSLVLARSVLLVLSRRGDSLTVLGALRSILASSCLLVLSLAVTLSLPLVPSASLDRSPIVALYVFVTRSPCMVLSDCWTRSEGLALSDIMAHSRAMVLSCWPDSLIVNGALDIDGSFRHLDALCSHDSFSLFGALLIRDSLSCHGALHVLGSLRYSGALQLLGSLIVLGALTCT